MQSIEGARRAPLTRLSDRLSMGVGSDVDDTMMDILANRMDQVGGGFPDESMDLGGEPMLEYVSLHACWMLADMLLGMIRLSYVVMVMKMERENTQKL